MAKGRKTGGRVVGSVNKAKSIEDMCEAAGVDPFQVMIDLLKDPVYQLQAAKELCQYLRPKKKALELTQVEPIKVIIESYIGNKNKAST